MELLSPNTTDAQEHEGSSRGNREYGPLSQPGYALNGRVELSDNGSSSLSDLEDVMDENEDDEMSEREDSEDPDTEAETERLEISPQKTRKHTNTTSEALAINAMMNLVSAEPPLSTLDTLAAASLVAAPSRNELMGRLSSSSVSSDSQSESMGRKRKRTSSVTRTQHVNMNDGSLRKPSSAARFGIQDIRPRINHLDDDEANSAIVDEMSDDEDLNAIAPSQNLHSTAALEDLEQAKDDSEEDEEEEDDEEVDSDKESVDPVEEEITVESKVDEVQEPDELVGADADEEEPDPAAKSEDEVAKKKTAMDALKPIEKLFAIFRDKLFDERLSKISEELEQLNQTNPTHPEYLAMRNCIDSRRDEKIQLEQVNLRYKVQDLETRTLANRSQLHSQYFQSVREIREEHIYKLNEHFSAIQKERRHLKGKETQFVYDFNPKRSVQITQQRAYNKEVSLLSGMARYVGFPAAPEIQGPSNEDIESDLRAMKIPTASAKVARTAHPKVPRSYMPRSARPSRAPSVSAAESQFIESTPWANPNHPAHQRGMNSEQQTMTMPHPHPPVASTPITQQRWMADHNLGVDSASTIAATPSDSHLSIPRNNETRLAKEVRPQKRLDSPTPNGPVRLEQGISHDTRPDLIDGKDKAQNAGPIPPLSRRLSPPRNHTEPSHPGFVQTAASKRDEDFDNNHQKFPQYGPLPAAAPLQLHAVPSDRLESAEAILESVFGRSAFTQGGSH